jgi:formylglycine-generating enzyme required for sulfatase activity
MTPQKQISILLVSLLMALDFGYGSKILEADKTSIFSNYQIDEKHVKKPAGQMATGFTNELGMEFVLIPAGTIFMGSPLDEPGRGGDEGRHKVTLNRPFYMQKTEVTQGQWNAVMGENPSHFRACGENCPVEKVTWHDAQRFIARLNAMSGTSAYRLPTEAEWEYAARAGSQTALSNGSIAVTGCAYDATLDRIGWYCNNSNHRSHPVAKKKPNVWGLYDMHGNVWEWCQDWYSDYPSSMVIDPSGPSNGTYRVSRGGSWYCGAQSCRSANRYKVNPDYRNPLIGFRLMGTEVLAAPGSSRQTGVFISPSRKGLPYPDSN